MTTPTNTRAVECPLCHAKPGDLCINTSTGKRLTGLSHRERFDEFHRQAMQAMGADDGV